MSIAAPPRVDLHDWETIWSHDDDAYELVAGVPTMTPPEAVINLRAAMAIRDRLAPGTPSTHWLLPNCGVHLRTPDGRDTVRQPDLVVLPRHVDIRRPYVPAAEVVLVVEVVSPSSIERDWVAKRAEYAAAGIPAYLIVDVRGNDPQVWLFDRLVAETEGEPTTYPRYADPTGDGTSVTLRLPGFDPITIAAADLV